MRQQLLTLLFAIAVFPSINAQRHILSSQAPTDVLEGLLVDPMAYHPVPTAREGYWQTIPQAMRNDYVRLGEQYLNKPWKPIPDSLFARFKAYGNRSDYEERYYALRRQLACLVMADVADHQGRFTADVARGLHYFMKETWWGIPANYPLDHPIPDNQVVDLFNAETAGLLAWTIYMLHDELEKQESGITGQIRQEIQRRLLTPALTIDYDWKRRTSNWNPWICSNWLTCVLFCENDRTKQLKAVSQILTCLDFFIDGNPDDGGCDEGVSYWDRAAGSLIDCLQLLETATNGRLVFQDHPKIQAMGSFIYKMYIGNGKFVNFADAYERNTPNVNTLFLVGSYLRNDILLSYAATIAEDWQFHKQPTKLFQLPGTFPFLGRELLFLSHYQDFSEQRPSEPQNLSTWLPNLQLCTVHSDSDSHHLFFAAKGGHNGESHNHNDVGNFIVYKDEEPLLIDLGVGTYTAQTFSDKRYELSNCRSAYHNIPLINGVEQRDGKQYRAKNVKFSSKKDWAVMAFDIAEAYPLEACVDKWKRTIRMNYGKEILTTENYRLSEYRQPTEIILICCGDAHINRDGEIVINNGKSQGMLHYDVRQLKPHIEVIDPQDTVIRNTWQRKTLYRIHLTVKSQSTRGKITYSIK